MKEKEKEEDISKGSEKNAEKGKEESKKDSKSESEDSSEKESAPKKVKMGTKDCTVIQYAKWISLGKRAQYWLRMKYDTKELRSANAWTEELIKEKAINKKPEILEQMVPGSK